MKKNKPKMSLEEIRFRARVRDAYHALLRLQQCRMLKGGIVTVEAMVNITDVERAKRTLKQLHEQYPPKPGR